MSITYLDSAVRSCQVVQSVGPKLSSDRFQTAENVLCPNIEGLDVYGRPVQFDTYKFSTAGCSGPIYRINIENGQRPEYSRYITLDNSKIQGNINPDSDTRDKMMNSLSGNVGNPATGLRGNLRCN